MQNKRPKAPTTGTMPDHLKSVVYQANYITNSRYNYTLIQERIFTYVMFYLQHYRDRMIRGEQIDQLEIFSNNDRDIKIHVPLSYIVPDSPAQYPKVRKSAKELAGRVVAVPYKDKKGRDWKEYTGLMSVHIEDEGKQRTNYIIIGIKEDVAKMLIDLERRGNQPINYTTFVFENAMSMKHKYTSRIYKYISSWKEKQYSYPPMPIDHFKAMLGCEKAYSNYADFKKNVLVPACKELKEKADCWFDMDYENFEQRSNGKVIALSFKVISQESRLTEHKLWDNNWNLLRTHFRLSEAQCLQLKEAFTNADPRAVLYKIMDLNERLVDNDSIRDTKSYVMKVLLREFA